MALFKRAYELNFLQFHIFTAFCFYDTLACTLKRILESSWFYNAAACSPFQILEPFLSTPIAFKIFEIAFHYFPWLNSNLIISGTHPVVIVAVVQWVQNGVKKYPYKRCLQKIRGYLLQRNLKTFCKTWNYSFRASLFANESCRIWVHTQNL